MTGHLASAFTLGPEGITSPSGQWALRYREDGVAALVHESGEQTWVAGGNTPAVGKLMLENTTQLTVHSGDEVVWTSEPLLPPMASGDHDGATLLRITDDGDGILTNQWGLPRYSLRNGVIEPVSLGDHAPVAAITGLHYLRSSRGARFVVRQWDGTFKYSISLGLGVSTSYTVSDAEVRSLEQDGTELTWRFLGEPGDRQWELVLLEGNQLRWNLGPPLPITTVDETPVLETTTELPPVSTAEPVPVEAPYDADWLGEDGLGIEEAYCVTAIRGIDADEALRRLGATGDQIVTATWPQLRDRISFSDAEAGPVAAFSIGGWAVVVEDNGYRAVYAPNLSRGTTAITAYQNINGMCKFAFLQDGEVVAGFEENAPSWAEGTDPGVLQAPLSAMGIEDPEAFDEADELLEELELLCRLAGIRPTLEDVAAPARGTALSTPTPQDLRRMMHPESAS